MRDELSDQLVPALTGRTHSHADFFWTMVFLHWVRAYPSEDERVREFLSWERCLKLVWVKQQPTKTFAGWQRATKQAKTEKPSEIFQPLLTNQRSQGLLGAHLRPLRRLRLASEELLGLSEEGRSFIEGAGEPSNLGATWESWSNLFSRTRSAYTINFRQRLRKRMAENMPELNAALAKLNWSKTESWHRAARHMGKHRQHAILAHEFCSWSRDLRKRFDQMVRDPASPVVLKPLRSQIPSGLERWEPLRQMLAQHKELRERPQKLLCELHKKVFVDERGYTEGDLWIVWENNCARQTGTRPVASTSEGGDCRWSNAIELMQPGK